MSIISAPATTVPFYELAGSPLEKYTASGFQAQREFLVDWSLRETFAKEIMGNDSQFDYRSAAYYPGRTSVFPTEISIRPADEGAITRRTLTQLHTDLNSYAGSWAYVTVKYQTLSSDTDTEDTPEPESGTQITFRLDHEPREEEFSSSGWVWSDTSAALPADLVLIKRSSDALYQLVWHKVLSPPWETIMNTQGKINQSPFLGCPAGTLLFEGALSNKLYRSTFEEGESTFTWAITYTFRQKAIHHDGDTYGWNYQFRASDGSYAIPTNATLPLYDSADFTLLFQSAE